MNILVVEPAKLFRELIGQIASVAGAHVETASSGEEGLEALKKKHFDLYCVAYHLGDMDSSEFITKTKQNPLNPNIVSVLITANSDELREKSLSKGFTEIFDKNNIESIQNGIEHLMHLGKTSLQGKVLLVEDSASMAQIMCSILSGLSLEVDLYSSGELALEAAKNTHYDLLITDFVLDGKMTGLSIVKAARKADSPLFHIPILAVSGTDDSARRIQLLRQGANDYANKPVQIEEFEARVINLIRNKQLIDQLHSQQEKLHNMAMTDQLTELYNRHSLMDYGPKYVSEAHRHDHDLSLLVIDLDFFKNINDQHGHSEGDRVLKTVGKLLNKTIRNEDLAARFGGEEFVIILSHCNEKHAFDKAESIRVSIEELSTQEIPVTASIGVSVLAHKQQNMDDLFNAADEAVYRAKSEGRNRVCLAPPFSVKKTA